MRRPCWGGLHVRIPDHPDPVAMAVSALPKEIWASLLDFLPELTRLADMA